MASGTEIFRVFGTLALREDGDIQGRLNNVTSSAKGTTSGMGKLSSVLGTVGTVAAGAAAALGVAVVAGLTTATKASDDYRNALGNMVSDTDATEKETKLLGETLKNVYEGGYGADINDTAKAIIAVGQATNATGTELEGYTKKVTTLSDKLGSDYTETIQTATVMSKTFGITIDESLELMAQGYQNGVNSSGDMLDVIKEYSVQYEKNGLSAEDFINTLIAGNENGVYSYDKLADMQKEFSIRAIDDSKATKEAFNALGLSYEDYSQKLTQGGEAGKQAQEEILSSLLAIEDPVERNKIGVALMGTLYEDLGDTAVEALVNIEDVASTTGDAMDKLNQARFDSLGEQFEVIKRKFEMNVLVPIGEQVLPVVDKAIEVFTQFSASVSEQFGKVKNVVMEIFEAFQGGDIDTVKEKLKGLFPEELSGIIDTVVTLFNSLMETLGKIGEFISSTFSPQIELLKEKFAEFDIGLILESLNNLATTFQDNILPMLEIVGVVVGTVLVAAFGLLMSVITGLVGSLDSWYAAILNLYDVIYNVLALAIQFLIGLFTGDFSQIKPIVEDLCNSIIDFFTNLGTALWELVSGIVESVIEFFTGLYDTLVGHSIIPDLVNDIIAWFAKLPSRLLEIVKQVYTYVTNKFTELKTAVVTKVTNLVDDAKAKFARIVSLLVTIISDLKARLISKWESIKAAIASKIESIKSTITSKFEAAKSKVIDIFEALKSAVSSKMSSLKGYIQPVIDKFNAIKTAVQGVITKISNLSFPSLPDWIPGHATGVHDFAGGLSLVGERGAELTYLPTGSDVYNARETKNILRNLAEPPTSRLLTTPGGTTGGGITKIYNISMQVNPDSIKSIQDFKDLIESIEEGR